MKKNMSNIDRVLRIALAIIMTVLYFTDVVSGTLGIVLIAVSGIFLLTSFISFCPLYAAVGLSTKAKEKA